MEYNKLVEFWATEFPFGFEEFVKGLSNEKRLAIASLLMEKRELRFSDIQKELGLENNLLSKHLKILSNYGLIQKIKLSWNEKEETFKYYYRLSPFYRGLLEINITHLNNILSKTLDYSKQIRFLKENYEKGIEKHNLLEYEKSEEREIPLVISVSNIGGIGKWEQKKLRMM